MRSIPLDSGRTRGQTTSRVPTRQRLGTSRAHRYPSRSDEYLRLARQIIFAWQDTADPSVQSLLEQTLRNAGLTRIGFCGEVVPFVARWHQCQQPAFPGDPVRIRRPGWLRRDEAGELLLAPAVVDLVPEALAELSACHPS